MFDSNCCSSELLYTSSLVEQPGERDNPVPAKAGAVDAGLLPPVGLSGWVSCEHFDER